MLATLAWGIGKSPTDRHVETDLVISHPKLARALTRIGEVTYEEPFVPKISIARDNASDIILHKLEWSHGTRLVSGLRRRFPASVSPWGGGGGRVYVRLHVGYQK